MNDTNINNTVSPEEIAIVNAAFRLHEIVIVHRCYKRGRGGKYSYTPAAFKETKKVLARLLPPVPGADPVKIVALIARDPDVTKAAITVAIERLTKSRQEGWDNIRAIEPTDDELKSLSYDSPIFKRYRNVTVLERAIAELSHPGIYAKAADAVWELVSRVDHDNQTVKMAA
ncbi:hypothetical protein [Bradyrhizobium cosmicum]|uniref:hypothetical protein n=1 Tax=Bradyrhizobium cosmicum TaxID=1404864 RepID=UPI0028E32B88|nr:hypothetical protein [Bradyrhizobium cosmicum]